MLLTSLYSLVLIPVVRGEDVRLDVCGREREQKADFPADLGE